MTLSAYANVGIGAKLYVSSDVTNSTWPSVADTTTANFTQVAELRSFNWDGECGEGEVTPMDSTGHRQFLPTYLAATANASVNYIPESATGSALLMTAYQGRKVASYWLEVPTRGDTAKTSQDTFILGFITSFRPTFEGDGPQTVDVAWRVADSTIDEND